MSLKHPVFLLALLTILLTGTVAVIEMLGEPVATPSPKYLTPELFDRIIAGSSQESVNGLLPDPRPSNLTETYGLADTVESSPSVKSKLIWREFGICGTYGTFIEFRIYFEAGKVVRKEWGGVE